MDTSDGAMRGVAGHAFAGWAVGEWGTDGRKLRRGVWRGAGVTNRVRQRAGEVQRWDALLWRGGGGRGGGEGREVGVSRRPGLRAGGGVWCKRMSACWGLGWGGRGMEVVGGICDRVGAVLRDDGGWEDWRLGGWGVVGWDMMTAWEHT